MAIRIKRFREDGGVYSTTLLGEPVSFTFRRPKTKHILRFERASTGYRKALTEYHVALADLNKKLELTGSETYAEIVAAANAAGLEMPGLDLGPDDIEPLADLIHAHITEVEGFEDADGNAVTDWQQLTEEDREDIVDTLNAGQLIEFQTKIVQSVSLSEAEKKPSTSSADDSTSTTPASATPATPSPDYSSDPSGDAIATCSTSIQPPSSSTPNGPDSSSGVAPP